MSFGNLKFFNSFHILQRFAKNLSFFCKLYALGIVPNGFIDKISYPKIKFYNKLCEPREFWNNSIYRLNQILNSLSKYLIFVALKCFNSIHKHDQFAKSLKFSSKLFQLWSFEVNQFISYTGSICETISAVTIFFFSKLFHRRNWFPIFIKQAIGALKKWKKKSKFLHTESARKITSLFSKLFTLWNFQVFHFIF